jgi:hypothetical protein
MARSFNEPAGGAGLLKFARAPLIDLGGFRRAHSDTLVRAGAIE